MFAFIDWAPSFEAFHIGSFAVRWYSLCWCMGLLSVYLLEHYLYKEQKVPEEKFEPLFMYSFLGILIGARLGHCLFYEPQYYLTSMNGFIEMLLPIKITAEGWRFVGYEGLASHGGTVGLMIALYFFVRRTKLPLRFVLDDIAIVTPICACFIRLGNLMNSEIIGRVTDVPWAFRFMMSNEAMRTRGDDGMPLPRHPGQLYEAICYAVFFFVGWWFYRRSLKKEQVKDNNGKKGMQFPKVGSGFFFGLCIFLIFTSRIFIEYTKEVQGGLDDGSLPMDMGQLLSFPFVFLGAYCMYKAFRSTTK